MEAFVKNPLYVGVKLPEPGSVEELEPLDRRLPMINRHAMALIQRCLRYAPEERGECWVRLKFFSLLTHTHTHRDTLTHTSSTHT
jgi:hypothetical protein